MEAGGPIGATAAGLQHTTATWDPSHIYDLHHSSWQRRILNPLNQARDQTRNLMAPSRIHFHCPMMGTPTILFFFRAVPEAYESFQGRGQIGDTAATLHHSHSNASSKPHLQPTPQLKAMPDP